MVSPAKRRCTNTMMHCTSQGTHPFHPACWQEQRVGGCCDGARAVVDKGSHRVLKIDVKLPKIDKRTPRAGSCASGRHGQAMMASLPRSYCTPAQRAKSMYSSPPTMLL